MYENTGHKLVVRNYEPISGTFTIKLVSKIFHSLFIVTSLQLLILTKWNIYMKRSNQLFTKRLNAIVPVYHRRPMAY